MLPAHGTLYPNLLGLQKTFLCFKTLVINYLTNTVRSRFSALTIYIPGVVFVADATTMYHCHANHPSIVLFSCLTLIICKCQFLLTIKFFIISLYIDILFFRKSTLKGPRPVVVWPHCINLSYMHCFLYSGSSINNEINKKIK